MTDNILPCECGVIDRELHPSTDEKWRRIRLARNALLEMSDWTQLPDAPLTEPQRQAWREYRQILRDITTLFDDPDKVVFPEPPFLQR